MAGVERGIYLEKTKMAIQLLGVQSSGKSINRSPRSSNPGAKRSGMTKREIFRGGTRGDLKRKREG